ncbi:hypothetical protein KR009_001268, partial [Drosophila setifemur]
LASPCGKCNACPCGTNGGASAPQQAPQRPPPSYVQQTQQSGCGSEGCAYTAPGARAQGAQGYETSCQGGQGGVVHGPKVECTCRKNRPRQPMTPQADVVHCSRPPREVQRVNEQPRCTCRDKPVKAECHCAPPAGPPPQQHYVQEQQPPSHAYVSCGQATHHGPQPYRQKPKACGHCAGERKKKKCVIQ